MAQTYVAGRRFKLFGKEYKPGDVVPDAQKLALQKQRALFNTGHLQAADPLSPEPQVNKTTAKKEATSG